MKVLLVVPNFYPEIGSASHLFFDLAKGFIKNGDSVEVLTSQPRKYNLKKERKEKRYPSFEEYNGIRIYRTYNIISDSIIVRGLEHFILPLIFIFNSYKLKSIDLVIIYSPPLPLFIFGRIFKKFNKSPFILNVQDLYPKTLTDVGILKSGFILKIFRWLEKKAYELSDFVTAHSEGNLKYIRKNGAYKRKSDIVYNWTDTDIVKPDIKKNDFRKKYNLSNEFIVSYAGIMNFHQDLLSIIESADILSKNKKIKFVFVGEGKQKNDLIKFKNQKGLNNVQFHPFIEKTEYVELLQASDVSIVTLSKDVKTKVVPGKLINIMSSSTPVLANVPKTSDAYNIVKESNCGYFLEPGNPKLLAKKIKDFYTLDKKTLKKMGNNGREYVIKNFSVEKAILRFKDIYRKICESEKNER